MDFRIADTFTDSLTRLSGNEQKAAKTTAFDLQLDPSAPGMSFHKLDRAKDPNFWSVRASGDIRLIVHRTTSSLLLCYVGHHDDAYAWAERRRIERHPTTGAAQLVTIPERVEALPVRPPVTPAPTAEVPQKPTDLPLLFVSLTAADILGVGVPPVWVDAVLAANELTLFDLADTLPAEAAEALLEYATAGTLKPAVTAKDNDADPFDHPDAQRRFRILENTEDLERALNYPWDKWTVFLHPAQRQLVEKERGGPVRISGSAGTGKTIVALHRAVFLAQQNPEVSVLLTTFSKALANALKVKLARLVGNESNVAARIVVQSITGLGYELYAKAFGQPNIAPPSLIQSLLARAVKDVEGARFPLNFLFSEWNEVVDAWQLRTWEAYRDVTRLGRKTRIGGKQREVLWAVFDRMRSELAARKVVTWSDVFARLTEKMVGTQVFDHAVVDEAQDVGVAEIRFLVALVQGKADSLCFCGDLGQRIFQQPFSWKSLGVDVRGRSHTLRINYRTSHQIRSQADRLLPGSIADVDGIAESRKATVSLFNGPPPRIATFDDEAGETQAVAAWLKELLADGMVPDEIGVFVRAEQQVHRARAAVKAAGIDAVELGDKVEMAPGKASISTMHTAKGLEFRAVAVMACDDEIVPLAERMDKVADDADIEEVYNTERHLLYVACTRARDRLLVTGVNPASEFLDDLAGT